MTAIHKRFLLVGALAIAPAAKGQTIVGTVAAPDARPVSGVLVLMLDSTSAVVARSLSNDRGEFRVAARYAGAYRLRTMRIGYRPTISEPIALLSGGQVERRLILSDVRVQLDTVRVVDRSSCRVSDDSTALATLMALDQARTAVGAAQVTLGGRTISATTLTYDRTLDPGGRRVLNQSLRIRNDYVTQPWRAISPDSVHRVGFVAVDRSNFVTYNAPSIEVLLSNAFVDDHCFRLVSDKDPSVIGVRFEPSRERRSLSEIQGTLWLDRKSAELRKLEYRYVNVSRDQMSAGAGGDVEFARLKNGGWAISRWNIRMPVFERIVGVQAVHTGSAELGEIHLAEIQVSGGELALVTRAIGSARDTIWSRPPLVLNGVVLDSVSNAAIRDARVELTGTGLTGTTDTRGRFAIAGVLPGTYTVQTRTPELDAIGAVRQSTVTFDDSTKSYEIRVPSAEQFATALCGANRLGSNGGMIAGTVTVRGDSIARRGVNVRAEWVENGGAFSGNARKRLDGRTDAVGAYRLCGVPLNTAIVLQAWDDSAEANPVDLRLVNSRFARSDLALIRMAVSGAIFTGTVVDSSRRPIAGVSISLPDLAQSTVSDSAGRFRIAAVAAGSHRVLVRQIGYGALDTTLAFVDRTPIDRRIVLTRVAALDSVVINATAIDRSMREFEENRRIGLGHFFTRADLEKVEYQNLSTVLAQTPGIGVLRARRGGYVMSSRAVAPCSPASAPSCYSDHGFYRRQSWDPPELPLLGCYAKVFLDDVLINRGHPTTPIDVDEFVPANIEGIEYYASAVDVPLRYQDRDAPCGVLVIHTRRTP